MTMTQAGVYSDRPRHFPSGIVLAASAELVLIAVLLRWSDAPGLFAASIACSLCAIQLGVLLISRFRLNTLRVRRLARQAEFSVQPVLITDGSGRIKWTNPAFHRLMGFSLSEIVGKTFSMVLHGQETSTRTVETLREKMRAEQSFEIELTEYDRSGKKLWMGSKGEPIRDSRGQLTHFFITQTDLTDQCRHIEQLTELEAARQLIALKPTAEEAEPELPIDGNTLLERCLGDSAMACKILSKFETQSTKVLAQIEHGAQVHDNVEIARGAHALRGTAALISAERVRELARQLEALGASDDRDQLQVLVDGLKGEVDQCIAYVPVLTAKLKATPSK